MLFVNCIIGFLWVCLFIEGIPTYHVYKLIKRAFIQFGKSLKNMGETILNIAEGRYYPRIGPVVNEYSTYFTITWGSFVYKCDKIYQNNAVQPAVARPTAAPTVQASRRPQRRRGLVTGLN